MIGLANFFWHLKPTSLYAIWAKDKDKEKCSKVFGNKFVLENFESFSLMKPC